MDSLVIPSTDPDKELRASTRPLDAHNDFARDGRRLAEVFAEMAQQWRGWKGEKVWFTTDHEVTLTFRHDRVSRVRVDVDVKDSPAANWEVKGELALELGALDRIANRIAEYLRV